MEFTDKLTGFIFAGDCVYGTTDGGSTWEIRDSCLGSAHPFAVLDSATALYQFGFSVLGTGIRRTTDGGETWVTVDTLPVLYNDFEFVTRDIGYAVGSSANPWETFLRKTTDGGNEWRTVRSFDLTLGILQAISFVSEAEGWAVTNNGTVYHIIDGGLTWTVQDSGSGEALYDVDFVTSDSGWAVGGFFNTPYRRTVDGGQTWESYPWEGRSLGQIRMLNSELGWRIGHCPLVGSCVPFIENTIDGGLTWTEQELIPPPPPLSRFFSISMVDTKLGFVVGVASGVPLLYRTETGGVTSVDNASGRPAGYFLSQNYPNPFNPITDVSFGIGDGGWVTLMIFDLLGREVTRIVNEELAGGTYTRQWDASRHPSGIYFYRLQVGYTEGGLTGDFVETKKLLLLK
ncbi:MAG: T9SS type A sorting domain-containing protein [Ignavibacteria bacterium]|nr:T9SS type A sorting domain-containing protein [Ignavibacteria bacterium]